MENVTLTTIDLLNTTLAFDPNITDTNTTTSKPRVPRTPPPPGYYGDIRIKLWEILPPIIMTWGILGNLLSVIILFRIARRTSITSTTIYLVALAISDTVILLCGPLRNWIKFIWEKDVRYYSDASCRSQLYFTYFSFHVSSWILVAITMERVASVVFPHKVKIGCTPRNAMITILTIVVVLGGFALVHPIIQRLESGRGNIKCAPSTPEWTKFRDDIYIWMDFFLSFGIPFLFLLIGNAVIIFRLNKSRQRQKKMNVSRGDGKTAGRNMRSLSILLISLSVIFLLTITPVNVFTVYYPYRFEAILQIKDPYEQWYAYQYVLYQHAIVNLVGYTNASFNFILYVLTGTKFRKEFVDMFKCVALRRKLTAVRSTSDTKQTTMSASESASKQSMSASESASKHSMSTMNSNQTTTTNSGNVSEGANQASHIDTAIITEETFLNTNQDVGENDTNKKDSVDNNAHANQTVGEKDAIDTIANVDEAKTNINHDLIDHKTDTNKTDDIVNKIEEVDETQTNLNENIGENIVDPNIDETDKEKTDTEVTNKVE